MEFILKLILIVPVFQTTCMVQPVVMQPSQMVPYCEPINIPMCKDMPYNGTIMPNILGDKSQQKAELKLNTFIPLLTAECSPDLRFFLCSVYAPVCTELNRAIPPCRSLCLSAKRGCGSIMNKLGFVWPGELECDKFPHEKSSSDLCLRKNSEMAATSILPVTHNTMVSKRSIKPMVPYCEPINIPMCKDIPYNETVMPNILGDKSQGKAGLKLNTFSPLVTAECSPDLRFFLCSVYTPVCTMLNEAIPPCRSLCLSAKQGCRSFMNTVGFVWPGELECNKFPPSGLCVGKNESEKNEIIRIRPNLLPQHHMVTKAPRQSRCEPIDIALCKGLSYNRTIMPNLAGHTRQSDAGLQINTFAPILQTQCSSDMQLFLCSVYAPVCTTLEEALPPCRSLCVKVKRDCRHVMIAFGLRWPISLRCGNFPSSGLCLGNNSKMASTSVAPPTRTPVVTKPPVRPINGKCEDISFPLCTNIPYNQTIMPNLLGHRTQNEARLEINQFHPIIQSQCSPHLRYFLCTFYIPVCTVLDEAIPPCKSLCMLAKRSCENLINKSGFRWPASLECDKFPEAGLCIKEDKETVTIPNTSATTPRQQTTTASTKAMSIGKCEAILNPMCKNIPYNQTIVPTILGHRNQQEATLEANQYSPLLKQDVVLT